MHQPPSIPISSNEAQPLQAPTPPLLFKYRSLQRLEEILQQRTLAWAAANTFNDPFDGKWEPEWAYADPALKDQLCDRIVNELISTQEISPTIRPQLRQYIEWHRKRLSTVPESARRRQAELEAQQAWQRIVDTPMTKARAVRDPIVARTRIFCLSAPFDNILLWAHYGDAHRGAAIGLSTSVLNELWGSGPRAINYVDHVPSDCTPAEKVDRVLTGRRPLDAAPFIQAHLFTKSTQWSYEQEYRYFVVIPPPADPPPPVILVKFDPSAIRYIILGCAVSDKDSDRVRTIAATCCGGASVHQLAKHRTAYHLELKDGPTELRSAATPVPVR